MHERAIAFPVEGTKPTTKDDIARYERRVKGIASVEALKLIERIQPYNDPRPADNPLALVHELDRIDKHHNIALVVGTFDMRIEIPHALTSTFVIGGLETDQEVLADHSAHKIGLNISRQLAFANFGLRKNQTVIPSIKMLTNAIREVVPMFAEL